MSSQRVARAATRLEHAPADRSPTAPGKHDGKYDQTHDAHGHNHPYSMRSHRPDENPDWSPDGRQIAFYSERRGNAEIFAISAHGGQPHRVTFPRSVVARPRTRDQAVSAEPRLQAT